jgi:hypothetical protein
MIKLAFTIEQLRFGRPKSTCFRVLFRSALSYLPQIFSGIEFTLLGHSQHFVILFLIQAENVATDMMWKIDVAAKIPILSGVGHGGNL